MKYNGVVIRFGILRCCFVALLSLLAFQQGWAFNFAATKRYTVEDGLPSSSISCLLQDSQGFIWIGTADGLSRFDGREFKSFRNDPFDSTTISANSVTSIAEDHRGNIWAGTFDCVLNRWDREDMLFQHKELNELDDSKGKQEPISFLYFYGKEELFYGTPKKLADNSIDSLRFASPMLVASNLIKGSEGHFPVCSRAENGVLLIGISGTLIKYDIRSKTYTNLISPTPFAANISAIENVGDGKFLVGTDRGFCLIELRDNVYVVLKMFQDRAVESIFTSLTGIIWIGFDNGLRGYSYLDGEITLVFDNNKIGDLNLEGVSCLMEDASGLLWVGTKYQGVFKLDFSTQKFNSRTSTNLLSSSNSDHLSISAIAPLQAGNLIFGSHNGNIYLADELLNEISLMQLKNQFVFNNLAITSLLELPNEDLLVGTNGGLFIIPKGSNNAQLVETIGLQKVQYLTVNAIKLGRAWEVWVATSIGLAKYIDGKLEFQGEGFLDATSLMVDDANTLWIGTLRGLYVVESGDKNAAMVEGHTSYENRLLSIPVLSIAGDNIGRIWLATKSGVVLYNQKKSQVIQFSSDEKSLENELICSVVCDDLNQVWVATPRKVFQIQKSGSVFSFGPDEGMSLKDISLRSSAKTVSGKIYFGGSNGLSYIELGRLKVSLMKPKLAISSVKWFTKDLGAKEYFGSNQSLTLRAGEELRVEFAIAALDFSNPLKNHYKYRIRGVDKDWTSLGTNNVVSFYQLSAGDYVIEMLGSNGDGIWAEKPLEFHLKITPPLLRSTFAIVFYILALLFIGQLIYNLGFRYLRRTKRSLDEEKTSKKLFEAQSVKLALINKNLTDSIDYAKRIQIALLPSIGEIRKVLPKSFLYFRPKDIVSGDFYAVFEKNEQIIVAVTDCTGHGVPGAFMSMIGFDMLKNIVNVQSIVDPAEILKIMNNEVVSMLRHSGLKHTVGELDVNDGMDMAICVIDRKSKSLKFSGAINSLYLIRNNEIMTYRGDRYSVGHNWIDENNVFITQVVALDEDDTCYMFSDGYVDQFGGSEGKKFKFRRFRHLLLQIHRLPFSNQQITVQSMMRDWMDKGNYPQVDDMLILGFNPLASNEFSGQLE